MKWFKHQTNARNDERMAKLADLSGLEGYGFYFMVLEIIAENMDETSRNYAEYSVDYWAKKLGILPNKFKKLLENCIESGLFLVEKDIKNDKKLSKNRSENYKIISPNILKYRDNHTKNLQVASKQELDKEVDKERDIEKDKKTQKADASAEQKFNFILPDWVDKNDWDLWLRTRKKKMIPEQMQAQVNKLQKWRDEGLDYARSLANSAENGYQGLFEPPLQTAPPSIRSGESVKPKRYFN